MKKRIIPCLTVWILLTSGILSAQNSDTDKKDKIKTEQTPAGINLSLWKNRATQRTDTLNHTCFNLGLLSSMNRLNGAGINALSSVTFRNMNGAQISGISNLIGGDMRGIQIGGICNVNGNNLSGVSISGLVGITSNSSQGITLSGLTNIVGDRSRGLMIGGLLNITGEEATGVHLAGLTSIAGSSFQGVSISGLLNIVGTQLKGLQLAGLMNITGEKMQGVQISPANITLKGKGLQIGLFNYYKDSFDGFQLGLVNANQDTRIQLMLFGGNTTKLNAGVRFKNKLFYTILGGGTHYLDFSDKFSASLFYRAGLELPLYKQLFLSGDLGYQHIETFKNKDYGIPARLYALQARVNLEYRLTDCFGVFITGGYGGSRYYNKGVTYDKGIILEGGVILLKY